MIVRRCLTLALCVLLTLSTRTCQAEGERWSRQVSNSEWIPLANPRTQQSPASQNNGGGHLAVAEAQLSQISPQIPSVSLPPALQQQYQHQLIQLQKTQENIQKLLLLQQQLRAQQQLLQSPGFVPSGFGNQGDDKQPLHQGALSTLQSIPDLAPEVLVPPLPSSEALPPVYPAQNFLPQQEHAQEQEEISNTASPLSYKTVPAEEAPTQVEDVQGGSKDYITKQEHHHGHKRLKGLANQHFQENAQNEDEEVQLVYVPAETLAQRGQPKRTRGRKQFFRQPQHQQHHQSQLQSRPTSSATLSVDSSTGLTDQDTFAKQLLEHLQREHDEKTQFFNEERMKEIARLNEEQKLLERKSRLQQEAIHREQEIQRQRETEKKQKELDRLEEMAKQRELQKIREAREKQRLEEIERRRQAELRAKEEKRKEEEARQREADRLAAIERQKELDIQRALEEQQRQEQEQVKTTLPTFAHSQFAEEDHGVALPLVRSQQLHQQHLTEISKPAKRLRGRQRQRTHHSHAQYQDQLVYREVTTVPPSPNQPPLSVYMGGSSTNSDTVKVTDVLKILKDAKSIAVLDTVGPETPQVFVGPTNLDPPTGYAKFDLPYLSSIDHNRVERKVDKLPFFVAPLSFDPPPGYSKIPFPAPHIGSVVVNTIDNSSDSDKDVDERNPNPTPLIEPNSYIEGPRDDQVGPTATTPSYDSPTTLYPQEPSNSPKYESNYPTPPSGHSGSRFRFRQYYGDNKPSSLISTSYVHTEQQLPARTKHKQYYDEDSERVTTIRPVQSSKASHLENSGVTYREQAVYSSTPPFQDSPVSPTDDPAAKEQDLAAQLALINQELAHQRNSVQRYNSGDQQYHNRHQNIPHASHTDGNFDGEVSTGGNVRTGAAGPTQYSLPAELPAISPLLPGLVNSLIEKHENGGAGATATTPPATTTSTTPPTTTVTTTTPRPVSTTYRPRGKHRGRVVATRPTTTTVSPTTRSGIDRGRRPYNRSKSRYTTTTENYPESFYESIKGKNTETTQKYSSTDHRRPTGSRREKFRVREKSTVPPETSDQAQNNIQAQQATGFDNVGPSQHGVSAPANTFLQETVPPSSNQRQQETLTTGSGVSTYPRENYPTTNPTTTENYPPLRAVPIDGHNSAPLVSDEYSRRENYPQSQHQDELRFPTAFEQPPNYDQGSLEKTPVNGFNYQAQGGDHLSKTNAGAAQGHRDYQYYSGRLANEDYGSMTTENPTLSGVTQDRREYSPVYNVPVQQVETAYAHTAQGQIDGNIDQTGEPVFVPLPPGKHNTFEVEQQQPPATEQPFTEGTTAPTTTTPAPVTIRQRVRGRGRVQQDSVIQTRPRGSQDEYVRFSVVNHDSTTRVTSGNRHGSRLRQRTRPQAHNSQVQTDGYDYVKIQANQAQQQRHQQRPITPVTTQAPITTTPDVQPMDEDIDYGFIRPPSFRPVHPIENRFPTPPVITFRPPLPQIFSQDDVPNDETAVESSPPVSTQILKNRPKYQTTNRRPGTKSTSIPITTTSTTTSTTTTTENIPIATVPSDTTHHQPSSFTVHPKSRSEESKQSKVSRGRVKRPGRKRVSSTTTTTSTTESPLDTNNELPPDENYPHVIIPIPIMEQQHQQQPIYEESFDGSQQYSSPARNRAPQLYDTTGENYPTQEFVLNFGDLPEPSIPRDEYDQTQLASIPTRQYHHSTKTPTTITSSHHRQASSASAGDIYGAESQWSTKLSRTSFQPSFAGNRVPAQEEEKDVRKSRQRIREKEKARGAPEIITIGPEVTSVTVLVSSDYNKEEEQSEMYIGDEESMLMGTTLFGRKTNPQEHTERYDATSAVTATPKLRGGNDQVDSFGNNLKVKATTRTQPDESSTEHLERTETEKSTTKKISDPLAVRKSGVRRKRVRVRVRPVVEDFVTAESQHFNSAINSLTHDQLDKYGHFQRESRLTTTTTEPPIRPSGIPSTTSDNTPQKSVFQDFLEEMLRPDDIAVPVLATSTSTELPPDAWTTLMPSTLGMPGTDHPEETTLTDWGQTTIDEATVTSSAYTKNEEEQQENLKNTENELKVLDPWEEPSTTSKFVKPVDSGDLDDGQRTDKLDTSAKQLPTDLHSTVTTTIASATTQKTQVFGSTADGRLADALRPTVTNEQVNGDDSSKMPIEDREGEDDENAGHPKNHRAKWSEVRYPSTFDRPRISSWNYETNAASPGSIKTTTPVIPGLVTKEERDGNAKTLSDYVKAIFDSMKSAEEEDEKAEVRGVTQINEGITKSITTSSAPRDPEFSTGSSETSNEIGNISPVKSSRRPSRVKTSSAISVSSSSDVKADVSAVRSEEKSATTKTYDPIKSTNEVPSSTTDEPSTTTTTKTTKATSTTPIRTTDSPLSRNTTDSILGKVLRTSTTTKVSHMTEICYRGRCVMTKPRRQEDDEAEKARGRLR